MTVKIIKHGTEGFPREEVRTTFWNNFSCDTDTKLTKLISEEIKERKILVAKTSKKNTLAYVYVVSTWMNIQ